MLTDDQAEEIDEHKLKSRQKRTQSIPWVRRVEEKKTKSTY